MVTRELEVVMEPRELKVLVLVMVFKGHLVAIRASISSSTLVNTLTKTAHSTKADRVGMTILKIIEVASEGAVMARELSKSGE